MNVEALNKNVIYYLATPYSKYAKGIDAAWRDASTLAGEFLKKRIVVFCPIAHSHSLAMCADIDPFNHEIWLPADKPFMDMAAGLIVAKMDGWKESYGIKEEIKYFTENGKAVFYLDIETMTLLLTP